VVHKWKTNLVFPFLKISRFVGSSSMKFKGSSPRGFKYNKNIDWAFKMNVYLFFPAMNDMDK